MNITNLLVVYTIVVLFSFIFNVFYILFKKHYALKVETRRTYWYEMFLQMKKNNSYKLDKQVFNKLRVTSWASAFIEEYIERLEEIPTLKKMVNENDFISLFSKKLSIKKKVFVLNILRDLKINNDEKFIDLLREEVLKKSLFLRISCLSVIFNTNDAKLIADTITNLSYKKLKINSNIINEFIDEYTGDKEELAKELYKNYKAYIKPYKKAFIYLLTTTNNHKYDKHLIKSFETEISNVQLLIMKLVSLSDSKEANDFLLKLTESKNEKIMEYAIEYLGNIKANNKIDSRLITLTSHSNYNIRNNSINSLIKHNIKYSEFSTKVENQVSREMFKNRMQFVKEEK